MCFVRQVDVALSNNQKNIYKNLKEQEREQNQYNIIINDKLNKITNEINNIKNELEYSKTIKTINIPYEEYLTMNTLIDEKNNIENQLRDIVREYKETFEYHNIQTKRYGEKEWKEIYFPLKNLEKFEHLLDKVKEQSMEQLGWLFLGAVISFPMGVLIGLFISKGE